MTAGECVSDPAQTDVPTHNSLIPSLGPSATRAAAAGFFPLRLGCPVIWLFLAVLPIFPLRMESYCVLLCIRSF